jgi:hypothetical protein
MCKSSSNLTCTDVSFCKGTGKSFIGAILAKFIHDYSERTILVVCFTNHAASIYLSIKLS